MIKPFFNRKYDPENIGESNSSLFWRWFDIITDGRLYLRRLYVVRTPLFSIMVHRIILPDPDRHLHDHPWNFFSIVLRGFYQEQRDEDGDTVLRDRHCFNFCWADGAHRITYVSRACTTLVITGPKRREWGFHTPNGWVHWRKYLSEGN